MRWEQPFQRCFSDAPFTIMKPPFFLDYSSHQPQPACAGWDWWEFQVKTPEETRLVKAGPMHSFAPGLLDQVAKPQFPSWQRDGVTPYKYEPVFQLFSFTPACDSDYLQILWVFVISISILFIHCLFVYWFISPLELYHYCQHFPLHGGKTVFH